MTGIQKIKPSFSQIRLFPLRWGGRHFSAHIGECVFKNNSSSTVCLVFRVTFQQFSSVISRHCCAARVSFKTICGLWDAVTEHYLLIDETYSLPDICLLSLQRPLLPVYFCGVGTSCHTQHYSYITAWLTAFYPAVIKLIWMGLKQWMMI